jgi:hypothetical protein
MISARRRSDRLIYLRHRRPRCSTEGCQRHYALLQCANRCLSHDRDWVRQVDAATRATLEERFTEQCDEYVRLASAIYPGTDRDTVEGVFATEAQPLVPTVLSSPSVTDKQRDALAAQFERQGVAYFLLTEGGPHDDRHPLLSLAAQLSPALPVTYAIDHPMEQHPEAIARFGTPDGTLKIYDLPVPRGGDKYREQAETNERFDSHNDGLGYGGKIATIGMYLDSAPLWGGFTYFQNLVRLSLVLAHADVKAFRALFIPDAITALRPRGKGAIRVTSPVLYINDVGQPQCFFRVSTGEYRITWRKGSDDLDRARRFLARCTTPFGPRSTFVHLMRPGEGVFVRNEHVVHGRTPFGDGRQAQRVLARKWFVHAQADAKYKHVPGMNVCTRYAALCPDLFGFEQQHGEWRYDASSRSNLRMSGGV